jgi:propanol-preferring alcohol dehydrogenase
MKAMILNKLTNLEENKSPLQMVELPTPQPKEREILIKVLACGVCHTDMDEIEGRTPPSKFPIILGHQIVGRVEETGDKANRFRKGERVGIAWIYSACGRCELCHRGNENLCDEFRATGRDANGGYAEYTTVLEDFAYRISDVFSDTEAAPLLCAGAIGYRALRLTGMKDGENIGLVGFGASGHLVLKVVRHKYPNSRIFVFSRTENEREFARELGALWAGDFKDESPQKLHCAIDTTPAWKPIVEVLKNLQSGGRLIINAIRKEERDKEVLLQLDYPRDLWMEKEIKSVANITRRDVEEFLTLAAKIPIKPEVQEFKLEEANRALIELKERKIRGAKVLKIGN